MLPECLEVVSRVFRKFTLNVPTIASLIFEKFTFYFYILEGLVDRPKLECKYSAFVGLYDSMTQMLKLFVMSPKVEICAFKKDCIVLTPSQSKLCQARRAGGSSHASWRNREVRRTACSTLRRNISLRYLST